MTIASVTQPITPLDPRLAQVLNFLQAGQNRKAMEQAERLASFAELKPTARAFSALAAAMENERDKALAVLADFPYPSVLDHVEALLAVGSAWLKLGDLGAAIPFLVCARKIDEKHPLIAARLGACLLAAGRIQEALPMLQQAADLLPQSGGAWLNLARARLAVGEAESALNALDKAGPLPDKDPGLYRMSRVEALSRQERYEEAEALVREAMESGELGATSALVQMLGARGRHDEAWHLLKESLEKSPDDTGLMELAAELAQVRGRFGEAAHWLKRALEKQPEHAGLWARLAMLSSRRLGEKIAREAADKALELTVGKAGPQRAHALAAHAHVLTEGGDHAAAETAYRDALALVPQFVPALSGLGHLLMQLGKVDEATACFEELKKVAPLQGWSQLIQAREVPEDPKVLEQMAQAARRPSLEGPVQSHLLFTLASAWEKKGEYDKAWVCATEANTAAKALLSYRPEQHRARVEREMARFSVEFMRSRTGYGLDSCIPTFVLGMPRSGTTLVEQIMGSHSRIYGAGELSIVPELIQKLNAWEMKLGTRRSYPECIDDMGQNESKRFAEKLLAELQTHSPTALRIVDKLPHNFEHIGLIKLLFPNAKILHLKREPRDVAMSNYFVDYAAKFGGMGFAYDLTCIGEQLVDHQRLMNHWHKVFPGQILEVDYDLLVEDVDSWAHQIIDYLELPWEEGVLSYQELDRAVKTASVWQVRQPVYKTSKAKWKRYEKYLEPLEAALAEIPPMPEPLPLPRIEPALFLTGMGQLQSGELSQAESSFRTLLQARPAHAAAHHFLGAALYQQGKIDDARKEMRRSLELHRGQVQWMENLAALEEHAGNRDVAAKLREAIERRKKGMRDPSPSEAAVVV